MGPNPVRQLHLRSHSQQRGHQVSLPSTPPPETPTDYAFFPQGSDFSEYAPLDLNIKGHGFSSPPATPTRATNSSTEKDGGRLPAYSPPRKVNHRRLSTALIARIDASRVLTPARVALLFAVCFTGTYLAASLFARRNAVGPTAPKIHKVIYYAAPSSPVRSGEDAQQWPPTGGREPDWRWSNEAYRAAGDRAQVVVEAPKLDRIVMANDIARSHPEMFAGPEATRRPRAEVREKEAPKVEVVAKAEPVAPRVVPVAAMPVVAAAREEARAEPVAPRGEPFVAQREPPVVARPEGRFIPRRDEPAVPRRAAEAQLNAFEGAFEARERRAVGQAHGPEDDGVVDEETATAAAHKAHPAPVAVNIGATADDPEPEMPPPRTNPNIQPHASRKVPLSGPGAPPGPGSRQVMSPRMRTVKGRPGVGAGASAPSPPLDSSSYPASGEAPAPDLRDSQRKAEPQGFRDVGRQQAQVYIPGPASERKSDRGRKGSRGPRRVVVPYGSEGEEEVEGREEVRAAAIQAQAQAQEEETAETEADWGGEENEDEGDE